MVNRKPATKYLSVIDNLLQVMKASEVNCVVVSKLVGITYITVHKYLNKERNITDKEIAKRFVAVTNLLNKLVEKGKLPIAAEINYRYRTDAILDIINNFHQ